MTPRSYPRIQLISHHRLSRGEDSSIEAEKHNGILAKQFYKRKKKYEKKFNYAFFSYYNAFTSLLN